MIEWVVPLLLGIGLSAATGLRVFLPFFLISLALHYNILSFEQNFIWLDNPYVVIALGIAVIVEIGGYYIPIVDHTLDIIGAPLAFCAGVVSMSSMMPEMPAYVDSIISLIVGGGTALSINSFSGMMRIKTTASFFGMANSTYSTIENILSTLFTLLAFLVPVMFGIGILLFVFLAQRFIRRWISKLFGKLKVKPS